MIRVLHIENYRSLKRVDVELGNFVVLVGANASGKSNFISALEFLRDCYAVNLPRAVSNKGGYENICFRRARRSKGDIRFGIEFDVVVESGDVGRVIRARQGSLEHRFGFRAATQAIGSSYSVSDESCTFRPCDARTAYNVAEWHFERRHQAITALRPEELPEQSPYAKALGGMWRRTGELKDTSSDELLFPAHLVPLPFAIGAYRWMSDLRTFQVSPSNTRVPSDPSGRRELEKDGKNLPAAINFLREEAPEAFQELLGHLRNAAPTFTEVETDYNDARLLALWLSEEGIGRSWPTSDVSDGTLRTLAIFLPLVHPGYSLVGIEEPEDCIHPWVIRDFVETCRQKSKSKQIILTTHSPILVSHLKPSELILVDRHEGATRLQRATDADETVDDIIREGIMDLGQYWNSGAMSAVPGGPRLEFKDSSADGQQ